MSQMWICRPGCGLCGWLFSGPPALHMECMICSSFRLLLLEMISVSCFLRGLAISVKIDLKNEYF